MLYYILFWTILGFIFHFYIIFGTNLLTEGPVQIAVFFAYFSVSQKRNIKRSPNGMKPSGEIFLEQNTHGRLENHRVGLTWCPRGWGARPPSQGAPPASRMAHTAPGALLLPIYTYVPQKLHTQRENPNSTVVASVPVEIPSWSLFREGDPSRRPSSSSSSPSP